MINEKVKMKNNFNELIKNNDKKNISYLNIYLQKNPNKVNINNNNKEKLLINNKLNSQKQMSLKNNNNKTKNQSTIINNNINNNKLFINQEIFRTVSDSIKPCYYILALKENKLASCSFDCSIKIYDTLNKFKLLMKIKAHKNHVIYITQLHDLRLISCSRDYTLKVIKLLSLTTYKIEQTLKFHKNEVLKVIQISDKSVMSCSVDSQILIYGINEGKDNLLYLQTNLVLHKNKVESIYEAKKSKKFLSASIKDCCVYICKSPTFEFLTKFYDIIICDRPDVIYEIKKNLIGIGGVGIYIIDCEKLQIVNVLQSNLTELFYKLQDGSFLTIEEYYNIRQYKYDNKNNTIKLLNEKINAHKKCIYGIQQLNSGMIVSCDFGGAIKLWN